jgi:hypothetical protein
MERPIPTGFGAGSVLFCSGTVRDCCPLRPAKDPYSLPVPGAYSPSRFGLCTGPSPTPAIDSVVRMLRCFTTWSPCPRFMWPPCPFVFVSPIATFWLESSSWFPHKIQNQRRSWYRSITIEIMIPFLSWRLSTLLFLNPLYHFSLLCLVWIILSRISSICGLDLMHTLTPIL